jgi:DNA-binding transcriptional MerR regulator
MRRTETPSKPIGRAPAPEFSSQQVADLVGLTTRAVRHYHKIGLVPEPQRSSSGYRAYGPEHVLILMRVKCLTRLGLSLEQVAEALDDPGGRQTERILLQLDRVLAERSQEIKRQRQVIAQWRQTGGAAVLTAQAGLRVHAA